MNKKTKIFQLALLVILLPKFVFAIEFCGDNFQANYEYVGPAPSTEGEILAEPGDIIPTLLKLKAVGEDEYEKGAILDIVLIMDRSGSMQGMGSNGMKKIESAKLALKAVADIFIDENNPQHRLGLVTYSSDVMLNHSLSSNYEQLKQVVDSFYANGATNIGGALVAAANHLSVSDNPEAKKFIILASDGMHNTGTPVDIGIASIPSNVTVYTVGIGVGPATDPMYGYQGVDEQTLKNIAQQSGTKTGSYFYASSEELIKIYQDLIDGIISPFQPENIYLKFKQDQNYSTNFNYSNSNPFGQYDGNEKSLTWYSLGKMINNETRNFELNYKFQGYGSNLRLNKDKIYVHYNLFGKTCEQEVSIPVLFFQNKPQCIGSIPNIQFAHQCVPFVPTLADVYYNIKSACDGTPCQYVCDSGYELKNGKCGKKGTCGIAADYSSCLDPVDLCSQGNLVDPPGLQYLNGRWNWQCEGINGGDIAKCSTHRVCGKDWIEVVP